MSDASEPQVTKSDKDQMLLDIVDATKTQKRAIDKLRAAQAMSPLSENPHILNPAIIEAMHDCEAATKNMRALWETFNSKYKIIKEKKDGEDDKGDLVDK